MYYHIMQSPNSKFIRTILSMVLNCCMILILLLLTSACSKISQDKNIGDIITSWSGRKIVFPDTLIAELQNHPVDIDICDEGFLILTVLNTDKGCTSCQMMLREWEQLLTDLEFNSRNATSVQLLYVIESSPKKEIRDVIKELDFRYPIIYDPDKAFEQLNKFPKKDALRTFLLDNDNKVIVIGNPITVKPLKEVYQNLVSHRDSTISDDEAMRLPYKLSARRVPLGAVSGETRKISSVIIKNIADSTIRINKVESSCPCVTHILRRTKLTSGSESELRIIYHPDSISEYDSGQEILRYVYIYFDGVERPAQIELYGYSFSESSD